MSPPESEFNLTLTRTINAPRDRVFQAWTDPAHLHRWWGAREGFTAPIAEVDLRTGGAYRLGMQAPDQDHPFIVGGVYREISPPEKLVFTWIWEKAPHDTSDWIPPETLVTVEFIDKGDATEVVLTHEQFPDDNMRNEHQQGWGGCLDSLTRYLATALSPAGTFEDVPGKIS